jgi:uncharacterized protein with PQ loop repeat
MDYANILVLVAGALTTLAFVPQVLKTRISKHAGGTSLTGSSLLSLPTGFLPSMRYGLMLMRGFLLSWIIVFSAIAL